MSVDTRTPRPGFDDQPPLSMLKVDSDPAQVIVNHASFRVKLASPQRTAPVRAVTDTARIPAMSGAPAAGGARRRAPVVWSGRSEPGDPGATGLLQAVRNSTAARTSAAVRAGGTYDSASEGGYEGYDTGATQVIPRVDLDDDATALTPVVGGGGGRRPGPLLPPMRQAVGAYDAPSEREVYDDFDPDDDRPRVQRHGADTVRHAYYPGRRMNLGVVLLPLRVFLGFISIYAGMGKLCDPVYFDGGERGSMVKWLNSLHPWALAEPLRDFALSHPVGAGLSIAFLQIVVGVLTVLGLWQRVAASFGAVLSAALLLTVSWRTVPAYDAPDIIYLAAWSPLIIAGAPVYSVDGRLAGEAWRKLGPRSGIWDLRRRVLRRGAVLASVVIGLTLLVGSVLGGAVRSSDMVTVPGPNDDPVNQLPGVPLPRESSGRASASGTPSGDSRTPGRPKEPSATRSSAPAAQESAPARTPARETASAGSGQSSGQQRPSQTQGTGNAPPRTSDQAPPPAPTSQGPSSSGGTGDGSGGGGTGGSDGSSTTGGSSSGGGTGARNPIGGLLG
ncbi:DoxX family membrane protein [Streptomyces liangshanensis]|uniref:DoxX family membrane protein n=1 Tax=Streptomyces liangshanensis TaxID=2717324 RepID=UPI0036DD117F